MERHLVIFMLHIKRILSLQPQQAVFTINLKEESQKVSRLICMTRSSKSLKMIAMGKKAAESTTTVVTGTTQNVPQSLIQDGLTLFIMQAVN